MKKLMTNIAPALLVLVLAFVGCKRDGNNPDNPNNGGGTSQTTATNLLIQEIYYFGNYHIGKGENDKEAKWQEGETPYYNKYIKITNPTDKDISLEGMGLALSLYVPSSRPSFSNSVKNTIYTDSLAIGKLFLFPKGNPKNILKPGDTRIIATAAINPIKEEEEAAKEWGQSELNFKYMLDLTKADYELNDKNKDVADLVPLFEMDAYGKFKSKADDIDVFDLSHSMGLALVKLGVPSTDLMSAIEAVKPDDKNVSKNGKYTRAISYNDKHHNYSYHLWAVFIPNEWVEDFVVVSGKTSAKWIVNAKLDKSHNGVNQNDDEHSDIMKWNKYGDKSLVRRFDGNNIVDTNDSKLDFEVKEASLFSKKN